MDAGLSRALLLVRRPATSLRTKTKSVNGLLRAVGACWPSNVTPPSTCHCIFFISFKAKVMKEIKKIQWQVRWYWFLLVGGRWERLQGCICRFYFQRVTLPVRFWVACGSPEQFRPRLPWWQPFVWRWLVISGAFRPIHPMAHHPLRRPSRRRGATPNAAKADNQTPGATRTSPSWTSTPNRQFWLAPLDATSVRAPQCSALKSYEPRTTSHANFRVLAFNLSSCALAAPALAALRVRTIG